MKDNQECNLNEKRSELSKLLPLWLVSINSVSGIYKICTFVACICSIYSVGFICNFTDNSNRESDYFDKADIPDGISGVADLSSTGITIVKDVSTTVIDCITTAIDCI